MKFERERPSSSETRSEIMARRFRTITSVASAKRLVSSLVCICGTGDFKSPSDNAYRRSAQTEIGFAILPPIQKETTTPTRQYTKVKIVIQKISSAPDLISKVLMVPKDTLSKTMIANKIEAILKRMLFIINQLP